MPTGQTANLGNKSGAATGNVHPVTGEVANSISYRGLENWWGNIWEWTDGINIKDNVPYVADHDYVSDKFDGHYESLGFTMPNVNGYMSDIGVTDNFDWGFLPSEVGASATTKLCDYYSQGTGNRAARRGGGWVDGSDAGPFSWHLYNSSSYRDRYVGARLLYVGGE
jgi:formylglycine-generating enzyme required for sulfatase activity